MDTQQLTPKLCECGCGQPAPIATATNAKYGWTKGQPVRFVSGHNNHHPNMTKEPPNPSGLCMCGCGQKTPLARQTDTKAGWIKGQPMRFCNGHGSCKPLATRFWENVVAGDKDECWIWQGSFKGKGYGKLSFHKRYLAAHRVSYELHHGPIPEGMDVCHSCDNPACVNPNHLWAGSAKDNVQDMILKGRAVFGGKKYNAT